MRSAVIGFIFLAQLALGSNQRQATMDVQNNVSTIGVSSSTVSGSRSRKSHKGTRSGRSGKSHKGTSSGTNSARHRNQELKRTERPIAEDTTSKEVPRDMSPVKLAIMDHRHALEQSFEVQYGYRLRFLYWITAWQTVPLNLPSTVLASLRLTNCDVKQCFDNIPQEGRDGLLEVIAHPIIEAFNFTQKYIFIPIDVDDYPISNRAVFAYSQPWTPPNGTLVRWICITQPLALEVARLYLTSLFMMVGPTLDRQVLGNPMGGSPSSHFLNLYLDHYEYRWAQSVAALAASHPAYRLAQAMLCFF